MFKRRGATAEPAPVVEAAAVPAGKGRATPSRKDAEAARAARVKPPRNTREARKLDRARTSEQRAEARKRMAAGDPRYLAPRDQGPARAWIRTLVDSRFSPGEYVLPGAALLIILPQLIGLFAYLLFYSYLLWVVVDSVLLSRRIKKTAAVQFPDEPSRGLGMYGVIRASQFRKLRMPKPAVPRPPLFGRRTKPTA